MFHLALFWVITDDVKSGLHNQPYARKASRLAASQPTHEGQLIFEDLC